MAQEKTFTQDDVDKIVGERLARDRQTRVLSEPRVYALDSPHSYYADAILAAQDPQGILYRGAHDRLVRYGVELAHEVENRTAEGQRAERILREHTRLDDADVHEQRHKRAMRELRALTTGGGTTVSATSSGSAFVAPFFLLDEWAMFRGINRCFADQCHLLPLPPYGNELYIPTFSSTTGVSQQTEGSGVSETNPGTTFQGSQVVPITGQITATQQLSDRGATGGGSMDAIIHRQLSQQLEEKVDLYTLQTIIAAAGTVSGASTWTWSTQGIGPLYQDIASAREAITDTVGVRLRATHFFSTSDFYSYVSRQVDATTFRPTFTPHWAPGFPLVQGADDGPNGGADAPKWSRFTGNVLPANVLWFEDDAIPASGSNNQLIVSAADQANYLLESPDPVFSAFPQTFAPNLGIVLNLRSYACAIARNSSGTQVITGNGYPTSLK